MIQQKCVTLGDKILGEKAKAKEDLTKQSLKLTSKINESANELNQSIMQARKEIEKLKNDLTDILESKHEQVLH